MNTLFAENLRKLRTERGLSQKKLGSEMFINQTTVARWESGVRLPDAAMIPRLAKCLGVDANTLFIWIDFFYFIVIGTMLLLSVMGLWFTAILPGMGRWDRRFFKGYFFVLMLHGALVKKDAGELSLADGFVAEEAEGRGWTGGLIGGLVGLMAGPVGALAGYAAGKLIGNAADKRNLEDAAALLEKAGEGLTDGDTAVLLLAQEKDEAALEEALKELQITITRVEAEQIAYEIEAGEKLRKATERMLALYGENKKITDGNYDQSLAVKCVNGTFVGKKEKNVIAFKGIPFVGKQPVGEYRWKAPVDCVPDDGVYEAYYFGKIPRQIGGVMQTGSLYPQSEECLYLNVWTAADRDAKKLLQGCKSRILL